MILSIYKNLSILVNVGTIEKSVDRLQYEVVWGWYADALNKAIIIVTFLSQHILQVSFLIEENVSILFNEKIKLQLFITTIHFGFFYGSSHGTIGIQNSCRAH